MTLGTPYSASIVYPSNPHEYSHHYAIGDASYMASQQLAYSAAPGYWLHDRVEQSRQQRLDFEGGGDSWGYPYPECESEYGFTSYHQTAAPAPLTGGQWSGNPSGDGEQPSTTKTPWTIPSYHFSCDPR